MGMPCMELRETFELHIPSVLGFEKVAMEYATSLAKMMNFPAQRIEDLKTAVAEACLNAIEHGNKLDAMTKVDIHFTIEPSTLHVAIRDVGTGIGQISPPSIERTMAGREKPRGWGIFLIKKLVDEVEFETRPGYGTVVRMALHLPR
jgi:serine/threonine-protein kinase RsbW